MAKNREEPGLLAAGTLIYEEAAAQQIQPIIGELAKRIGRSRDATGRMIHGKGPVSDAQLAITERVLDMPRGLLISMRALDVEAVQALGADPGDADLIRRAVQLMEQQLGNSRPNARRRASDTA